MSFFLLIPNLIFISSGIASPLNNGGVVSGSISSPGEEDSYTFIASEGDSIHLRVADISNGYFYPKVKLYAPSGGLINTKEDNDVAYITRELPETGLYNVVLADSPVGIDATGNYKVYFALMPGANEGGKLFHGDVISETIDLGDLDSFTFDAQTGEKVTIRVIDTSGGELYPRISLYDPNGKFIDYREGRDEAILRENLNVNGTYTVVIFDSVLGIDATGNYTLEFSKNGLNEAFRRSRVSKAILQKKYGVEFIPNPATGEIFSDVQPGDLNADWIEKLLLDGITEGCSVDRFCPEMTLTKEQLAKILLKAKHGSGYIPPVASGSMFSDVNSGSFAVDWIEALSDQGISQGCDNNKFCPKEAVTIEGLESMLNRTFP